MKHRIAVISDTHGLIRDEVREVLKTCQLPRPTAKALEVGACNCLVVQRITPPTFGRLALQLKVALHQGTLTRTCTTEIYSVATA